MNGATGERGILPPALTEVLFGYGVDYTELAAYEALLHTESATATQVARQAKQSRGRIYEVMRSLVEKGMAREEPTQPVKFHAVPLHEVIERTISEVETHLTVLRQAADQVPPSRERPAATPQRVEASDISLLKGRRAVAAEIRRLVRTAHEFVYIGGACPAGRIAAMESLLTDLNTKSAQGVHVSLVLPHGQTGRAHAEIRRRVGPAYVHETPRAATPPIWYATNESVAVFVFVQPADADPLHGDDIGIRIASPAAVEAAVQRLRIASSDVRVAGTDDFGLVHAETVRRRFQEAIGSAKQEILGMAVRRWNRLGIRNPPLETLYERARANGVSLKALVKADPTDTEGQAAAEEPWEIRHAPWVPSIMSIVDEAELFEAFVPEGEGPVRLRYSNDPHEVRHYVDVFHRLWKHATPLPPSDDETASSVTRASGDVPTATNT